MMRKIDEQREALANFSAVLAHDLRSSVHHIVGFWPQLVQLLQNLIGNGIKYCRQEVPTVHVSAERSNEGYRISVRDNGIGIPGDACVRIFEPFRRLHGPDEFPGTGLGLATCKKIVERHRGLDVSNPRSIVTINACQAHTFSRELLDPDCLVGFDRLFVFTALPTRASTSG